MAVKRKVETETEVEDDARDTATGAIATLRVGNNYCFKNTMFKRDEPRHVTVAVARELEEIVLGSRDTRSRRERNETRFEVEYLTDGETEGDDEEVASSGAKRARKVTATRKPSRASRA